ncbi:MAG: chemotaxis protein CheW, partial [Bdellovibrionales bacterium]|nr:chemotaxis protein CheW [Bdellovibrionales bacterium]
FHEMTPVPLSSSMVEGLINLRGQIITAIDLRRRFGMDERLDGMKPMNVVVRTKDGTVSLLVDRIGDVLEVERKQHERTPETLPGVSRDLVMGVYKLSAGLLLILDTEKTVDVVGLK